MDVRLPDGTIIRGVPEGITKADLVSKLQKNGMAVPADWLQAGAAAKQQVQQPTYDPTEGMSKTERVLAGIGQGMSDFGYGVGQMVGLVSRDDVKAKRKLDEALLNTTEGKIGSFVGTAAPGALAAMVPGANTILGSTLIGAGMGVAQPSTSTSETLQNGLMGGAASAAVPVLMRGGQVVKSFVDPFREAGREQIIGKALNRAAGANADDAIRNLKNARQLVPGVNPTAAEVAQNPGIAALQRTATAIDSLAMNASAARQLANNEARIAALKAIAGDRGASVAARDAATEALYQAASGKTISLTPELESLMKRPVMQSAVGEARTLAANEGLPFSLKAGTPPQPSAVLGANGQPLTMTQGTPGYMLGRDAHTIKRALDDTIEGLVGQQGLGKNAQRAAIGTKEKFLSALESQVPEYGAARETFARLSRPVNQADVAEAILQRSTGNIQGNMTPAAFNRALSDRTAQSALGRKSVALTDVFDPTQMQTLNGIKQSLQGLDFANTAGRGVGSDTVQKLAYANILDGAGIPNFIRNMGPSGVAGNVLERFGQLAYADANKKMSEKLAMSLLDPDLTAKLMAKGAESQKKKAIENAIKRIGTGVGSSVSGLLTVDSEQ